MMIMTMMMVVVMIMMMMVMVITVTINMVFSGTLTGGMLNRCRWFLQGGGCFALPTAIGHPHPHDDDDDDVWDDE